MRLALSLINAEAEVVLHLEAVDPGGPVPAELLQGFDDGKARQPNAALGGAIAPHVRLAFQESGQVVHMGPRFVGRLCGQVGILLRDKGELQVGEMVLDGRQAAWRGSACRCVLSHGGQPPMCRVAVGLWGGVINAEIRGCEADVEEIAAPGEMEGAGLRGEAGALLHQVGDIFRGEGLVDKGILHRPGHGLRGVDVAQGDDFAHVMVRIEAPLFQLEVIRLRPRREREKAHEDLVIAGFFALLQERLGVIGVFDILYAGRNFGHGGQ